MSLKKSENDPMERQRFNEHDQQVINRRNGLLEILVRKDDTIKTMSSQLNGLTTQLESAVQGKFDALARLAIVEGKERALSLNQQQMDSHKKLLNERIENLTETLNKTMLEVTAVRQELTSASVRFKIDLDEKSEQLRIANVELCELRRTNESLMIKNEEYACKLNHQMDMSAKLIEHYENDLEAKTELAELYRVDNEECQAYIDDLTAAIVELKLELNQTYDDYGMLETKLNDSESQNRNDSMASNDIIVKLKQELTDANSLLKTYHTGDDGSSFDNDIGITDVFPFDSHPLKKGMTFTEMYTQYRSIEKKLQNKELETKFMELEMNVLIEDLQQKSKRFQKDQIELTEMRATNTELIEERNSLLADRREEMKNYRESLTAENDGIKSTLKFYKNEFSLLSNTIELEQQHRQLLAIVHNLFSKIEEIQNIPMEIDNHTIGDGPSTTDDLPKSEEVAEGEELMIEDQLQRADSSKIVKFTEGNDSHRNEVLELNSNKNLALDEANRSTVHKQFSKATIKPLEAEVATPSLAQVKASIEVHQNVDDPVADHNSNTTQSDALNSMAREEQLVHSNDSAKKEHRRKDVSTPKTTLSLQADCLKRSLSAQKTRRSKRSNKIRRMIVESSDGSNDDEIIVVCDDGSDQELPDIELQFVSEERRERRVRTRHQTQSINEAFNE